VRRYFREVTYAVSYIHGFEPPVVHRDLKPENVLLRNSDPKSSVKLIDFGLAALSEGTISEGEHWQTGTLLFMAPEQYLSVKGAFTKEMDLWALGVFFTWIITSLEFGKMLHPVLDQDGGDGFDVGMRSLMTAFRNKEPLREQYFDGLPGSVEIAKGLCNLEQTSRTDAKVVLKMPWCNIGDEAASIAARILKKSALMENIVSYHKLSRLDQRLLQLIADNAPDMEVTHLRRTFRSLDENQDGCLSKEELINGFTKNDVEVDVAAIDRLFEALGAVAIDVTDGKLDDSFKGSEKDLRIEYNEWLAATLGSKVLSDTQARVCAFRVLDASGTGKVSFQDLLSHTNGNEDDARKISPDGEPIDYKRFSQLCDTLSFKRKAIRTKVFGEVSQRPSKLAGGS